MTARLVFYAARYDEPNLKSDIEGFPQVLRSFPQIEGVTFAKLANHA